MPRALALRFAFMLVLVPASDRLAAGQSTLPPLLPESREIALALSAAPAHLSSGAAVYVLRRGGFVKVRESSNGFSCLVERDHPESLAPVCYDEEGSRTILPAWLALAKLREEGLTYADAKARVLAMFADGTLTPPSRPAMSYMMSPDQVLYSAPDGQRVGAWHPHIMLFTPGLSNAQIGTTTGDFAQPFVAEEGTPLAHLVVIVPPSSGARH